MTAAGDGAELIELARRPDPTELLARVRERKARTGSRLPGPRCAFSVPGARKRGG